MEHLLKDFVKSLMGKNIMLPYGSKMVKLDLLLKKHINTYLRRKKLVIEQSGGKITDVYIELESGKQSIKYRVVDLSE